MCVIYCVMLVLGSGPTTPAEARETLSSKYSAPVLLALGTSGKQHSTMGTGK